MRREWGSTGVPRESESKKEHTDEGAQQDNPINSPQVLILAMAVSFGFESWIEGGVITFVILLNVVVGFFQEYSAEKTMDSLRSLSSPTGTVVRAGQSIVVPSADIVPGDLIEIKTGDTIPADVR